MNENKLYDRSSHPWEKLNRFLRDVEEGFKGSKDDLFKEMLEQLSPESKNRMVPDDESKVGDYGVKAIRRRET